MSASSSRAVAACILLFSCIGAGPPEPASSPAPTPAQAAFAAGDFDAALSAAATAANANDVPARLAYAAFLLYRNELDAAERQLHLVTAVDPANVRAGQLATYIAGRRADASAEGIDPYTAPATIPFVVTDPLPVVRANVNGHDALFMIDTGAANIVLDPAFAAETGVALSAAGTGIFAGGMHAAVQRGTAARVAVGPVVLHAVPVDSLPTRGLPFFGERHVDGVIGTRFLAHFLSTLDYVHGALILQPRSAAPAFERGLGPRDSVVPMALVGDHFIFVRGRINDGPIGLLNVDTGLAGGGLMPSQAALANSGIVLDEARAGQGMGAAGPVRVVPFTASVTVGERRIDGITGLASPAGDPYGIFPFPILGGVSHGYFRTCALTFDFAAMRLIMQPG